ncbi:MAG: 50S ribosomal protein L1 [bacterium]
MKKSKKYQAVMKKLKKSKKYSSTEAFILLPQLSTSKFVGSAEIEILLSLKEKQKKDTIRGSYTLPVRFGKETKVLVFAEPANISKAEKADVKGGEDLIAEVMAGKIEYDVVISTPAMMPKIARLGKILGTKGLMPNPKNGTVSTDLEKTINNFKSGLSNFKMKDSKITAVIGKTDMKPEDLEANFQAIYQAVVIEVQKFGPNTIKRVKLSPTMGPSIEIEVKNIE